MEKVGRGGCESWWVKAGEERAIHGWDGLMDHVEAQIRT